jgi:DNA-binding winged helix-turn-helix (wHTH) protein
MKLFPPFRLDGADQSLWRDDKRIPLTPKAFAVLQYLVDRAGRLVTQNELLEALWPDIFVQPEVLKSQILDVRTALGDRPKDPLFIETVPRRGYRFIAPVRDSSHSEPCTPESGGRKLVGRDPALQELRAFLRRASAGERQVLFVTGEPGMGKTTVVEFFIQELSGSNAVCARGQCMEAYAGVREPYYPVLEALGGLCRGPEAGKLAEILETQAPTWFIQFPALLKKEHRETLQRELAGATRERMIREICEALESLTIERTFVLLFEDLHWADHSTVDLISAIARRRAPARLLVLGTYRPVDVVLAQHPLKQMSQALKAHRLCQEIMLPSLVETDIAEYLDAQATASEERETAVRHLAQWIQRQTEGNPLFMVTLIEHLERSGHIARDKETWKIPAPLDEVDLSVPDTLRQMIEVQIEMLSPREQLALGAASVHGMVFSASATASVLELDLETVEDICHKLSQHHHMIRDGAPERLPDGSVSQKYEFIHAVFRSVFYQRLTPVRRAKLHHRFGKLIEERFQDRRAEIAAELAGHYEQAGDLAKAVECLRLTVQNAWRRFAYAEAILICERGLLLTERLLESERIPWEMRFHEMRAVLALVSYEPSRALQALEAFASRAAGYGVAEVEARALVYQLVLQAGGDSRACVPILDRLRTLSSEHKGPLAICAFGWNAQLAQEHAEYLADVRRSGDRANIAMEEMAHCYVEWLSSRYTDCIQHAQQSLPVLLECGQLNRFLLGRDLVSFNRLMLGDWGNALNDVDESIRSANKNAAPHRLASPQLIKAWVHFNATDYRGVIDLCANALPLLDEAFTLDRYYQASLLQTAAELRLTPQDAGMAKLHDLRRRMEGHPVLLSWYWCIRLQLELVEAYLAKRDLPRARLEANRMLEDALATAERTWQALAWDASARVALQEKSAPRAESELKNALDVMSGFQVPLAACQVHKTAALLSRVNSNGELLDFHLARAREVVLSVTKSLESRPALQQIFRSSPAVSEILGNDCAVVTSSN